MAHTLMSSPQFFPIPPELFARACETVSNRVSRLPFLRGGVNVTGEVIGIVMECLNAVPTKSLALTTPQNTSAGLEDGLDRYIEQRLHMPGKPVATVIAEVLCTAGIAEPAPITDRHVHHQRQGIRLVALWTWHIASMMAPSIRLGGSDGNGANHSWMDVCPVCRTGILSRVTGKQLFGIPHTDFYIECSSCGGKFIPVGPAFRLVSIGAIRDPLWKKNLDKTHTPQEWSQFARGTTPGGNPPLRPVERKPSGPLLKSPPVTLIQLKDGSLGIPFEGKTLYFRPIRLNFAGGVKEDAFTRGQKTLQEVLENPVFGHLKSPVNAKYSRYLPLKTGLFLGQLKERHDLFYREFLHLYGDEKYGTFRLEASNDAEKQGVLIVVVNRALYHVVHSTATIRCIVNDTFGRVLPEDCYLSGDPVRCQVNALLCNNRKESGLYFYTSTQEEECARIAMDLQGRISAGSL